MAIKKTKTFKTKYFLICGAFLAMGVCFFGAVAKAQAATYWVSSDGAASWSGCQSIIDLGENYCALSTANTNAVAGDIIKIKAGTYSTPIAPLNSGTNDNRITYQAAQGETPTFIITDIGLRYAIRIIGKSFIVVDGIVSDGSLAFFYIGYGATYNEIKNSTFKNSSYLYSLGLITSFNTANSAMITTKHNWIHNNIFSKYGNITSSYNDNGTVRISGEKAGELVDDTHNNTFEYNYFEYGGHDNLHLNGRFNVARNNVFQNSENYFKYIPSGTSPVNTPDSGYFGNRCIITENGGDYLFTAFQNLIEGNRIGHSGVPPDDDGANGIENAGVHSIIRHNYVYNAGASGIYLKNQPAIESYSLTGNAETNILNWPGHTRKNGSVIFFSSLTGGAGIETNKGYYAVNVGPGSLQISETDRGNPVDFITDITASVTVLSTRFANSVSGNSATNIFSSNDHGLWQGEGVYFITMTGGEGLDVNTQYFVVNPTATTFQLSTSIRGEPVDFTTDISYSVAVVLRHKKANQWTKVYNNTVYHSGYGDPDISLGFKNGIMQISSSIPLCRPHPTNVSVKNNIVFDWNYKEVNYSETRSDMEYINNFNQDPLFNDTDISDVASLTSPELQISSGSGAVNYGTNLTQANGAGSGTTLVVDDVWFFQDGSWGSALSNPQADWIAIGDVANTVQIKSINYQTHEIVLSQAKMWNDDTPVWLYKKSDGKIVLYGDAPDAGAHEYIPESFFLPGDLNSDGVVNIFDYNIFLQHFGVTEDCQNEADLNGDCAVNIFDYNILLENFGRTQ